MKKVILASVLVLAVFIAFAPFSSAEMAKEGTGSQKVFFTGTSQMLPLGKERVRMNFEGFGIVVSDTGKGLFHNSSRHVLGGLQIVKGAREESGFIVSTLTNGDKVFITYKGSGKMGKPSKGTYTYVGGTGKVSGIQGGGEYTTYSLQPPAKGKWASFAVLKFHWKIVEPKK